MKKDKEIPYDVFQVQIMEHYGALVGEETYEWAMEVIKNNPKYFPWWAKYNSIPQEVHDAYRAEAFPPITWESWSQNANKGDGIMEVIRRAEAKPEIIPEEKPKSLTELIDFVYEMEEHQKMKEELARKEKKALWDKHYKKYGLEYRG